MTEQLKLSNAAYGRLWDVVHSTRRTSKTVTVDKEALINLLADHAKALTVAPRGSLKEAPDAC